MAATTERAILAGGCFWGMRQLVRRLHRHCFLPAEELQQVEEARLAQIKRGLDCFRMRAVVAARGVLEIAARVSP